MTTVIERLREMAEADPTGLGLIYEMLRNDAEVAKAMLDVAEAAQRVVWFDWSGNDADAVAAIDKLRATCDHLQELSDE